MDRLGGVGRRSVAVALLVLAASLAVAPGTNADWTAYHQDPARDAVDQTTGPYTSIQSTWSSQDLGGLIWNSPLMFRGLVIVATEHNDVYGLDEHTGKVVWHQSAGTPEPSSSAPCTGISPEIGITSTPVIDPSTGTLYVVADQWDGSSPHHVMIAYNAFTGGELWSKNVDPPGADPFYQLNHSSLNLAQGHVVFGFGGNDGDCLPYWGWLVSVSGDGTKVSDWQAASLSLDTGAAIWAPSGPTVDSAGNVYAATGNSAYGTAGDTFDNSEAVLRFPSAANLQPADYFAPANWYDLNANDADLGSSSPVLLPGGLIYQEGKDGNGYLLAANQLGGIGGQLYKHSVCGLSIGGNIYYQGYIYVTCHGGPLEALTLNASAQSFAYAWSGPSDSDGSPIIAGGLVWVMSSANGKLYGLAPTTGTVVADVNLPAVPVPTHLTPAASDGQIVVPDGSSVVAYSIGNAVSPPAPPPATTTTLSVSPSAPVTGQTVTLTATVAASAGAPVGTVEFEQGGAAIAGCARQPVAPSGSLFVATCQTAFLAASSPLQLVAVFTPAAGAALQGSASAVRELAIGRAPTGVALRASTSAPRVGARVTLTATVGPAVTGTVAFVQDRGSAIAGCTANALSAGVATCTTSYARPALHEITAEYSGDANYQPSSSSSWLAAGAASRSTVRIRGASLRGLLGRSPVFAFTVSAGAAVKRVVVILPPGLSFSRRTARAALVTNASGKRLRRSARLQGRALVITLATPSKRIHVSLTAAVHPAESLAAKVRHHRVKTLRITLDVMTARGQVASLVATLRV